MTYPTNQLRFLRAKLQAARAAGDPQLIKLFKYRLSQVYELNKRARLKALGVRRLTVPRRKPGA